MSNLVKKTKFTELEIPNISNLATKTALTTVENKIPSVSVFNARLAQANLITKTDFEAKLSSLNRKIT